MSKARVVVVMMLILVGACSTATWRARHVEDLGQTSARYLVVTQTQAYQLDDAVMRDGAVTGTVIRAWTLSATQWDVSELDDRDPVKLASQLGWTPAPRPPVVTVPAASIVAMSRQEEEIDAGLSIVSGLGITLLIGALGIAVLAASLPACGRPLRVRGKRCITPVASTDEWIDEVEVAPVPAHVHPILLKVWTEEAQAEHAAIAAFGKLSLELIALGAPPDLVIRAHRAALQEVQHAKLCFGVASAYAGKPLGPAPLPEALAGDTVDLERIAREALLDGCLREGLAAEIAVVGASTAIDPTIARVMRIQAREEAQHAELGWAIVEWAVSRGGDELRALLLGQVSRATFPRCDDLPEYGRVPRATVAKMYDALLDRTRARLRALGAAPQRAAA